MYCLPIAKRSTDRLAIRKAVVSGDPRFFFGSDSAPHKIVDKEKAGGAAGIFSAPTALPHIVHVFEKEASLDNLEAFMSLNGAMFYGFTPNPDKITLKKATSPVPVTEFIAAGRDLVNVFTTQEPLRWLVEKGLRETTT
jgi:dihydroorotase